MTEKELKNKCKERAKIFQQAMESCKSSSPMDCIEWFADRIVNLEKSCDETQELLDKQIEATYKLVEENAELEKENESLTNVKNIYIGDLLKAKEIIKIAIEGIKNWGFVGGTERPFVKQAEMYFNLFLDKAEQFIKE